METLKQFSIPFASLKNGLHQFTYSINEHFFTAFSYSPLNMSNIDVTLNFDKQEDFFALIFNIDGIIKAECDRCSAQFDLPISGDYKLLVKFDNGKTKHSDEIDIVYLSSADIEINVAQHIYEACILCIPARKIHPVNEKGDSGCRKEVLEFLEKDSETSDESDPRWDALKKLRTI